MELLKKLLQFIAAGVFLAFISFSPVAAQGAGGDLGGSADIFKPKNPESNGRKAGTARPGPKATAPGRRLSAAEAAARFEDSLEAGNKARNTRDYLDAERNYKAAAQLVASDYRAQYGLGNIFVDQQRWDEADRAYRTALALDKSNADIMVALSFVLVQPRSGGSMAARLSDAETFARDATVRAPANAVAFDRLGAAREARGLTDRETENAYRRAVEIDEKFAVAHAHLAKLLRKLGRTRDADTHYDRAIALATDAPTLVVIADALQLEQRYDKSEPLLRRALATDERYPAALFLLGRAQVVRRDLNAAEATLVKGVEVSPRSFAMRFLLGRTYQLMERFEDAERSYEVAVPLARPSDRRDLAGDVGLSGVGDGYRKAGRLRDALRVYERASQLDPANGQIRGRIAEARARVN